MGEEEDIEEKAGLTACLGVMVWRKREKGEKLELDEMPS